MDIKKLRTAAGAVLDLLYPPDLYCICCGKIIDESRTYRLCNDCMDGIKWVSGRTCTKCGRRLNDTNPLDTCYNCREHPHTYDRGYTCTEYGTHERAMVFALKYDGRADIAGVIGEIMADRMLAELEPEELASMYDLIVPVPVHARKKAVRGYNQAALICEAFAGRINSALTGAGLRCDDGILLRTKETHVMRSLGPDARRENIRGAFEVRKSRAKDIAGRSILLVDDIYTTGATVDEISSALKEPHEGFKGDTCAGAARVDVLTFAAGADVVKS